jgi:hypothetical protein
MVDRFQFRQRSRAPCVSVASSSASLMGSPSSACASTGKAGSHGRRPDLDRPDPWCRRLEGCTPSQIRKNPPMTRHQSTFAPGAVHLVSLSLVRGLA